LGFCAAPKEESPQKLYPLAGLPAEVRNFLRRQAAERSTNRYKQIIRKALKYTKMGLIFMKSEGGRRLSLPKQWMTTLYVGEISNRFWYIRTPKSLLLHALFLSLPLSKINIIFRYTSQEAVKLKY
jgi:hypothetical protein